jgi:branched-chain amino acid transport system substrate-binding protein
MKTIFWSRHGVVGGATRPAARGSGRIVLLALALLTCVALLSGCVERVEIVQGGSGGTGPNGTGLGDAAARANVVGGQDKSDGSVVAKYAGTKMSFGTVPAQAQKAGGGDPIRIGMINQENTPLGSFPELRLGAQAAVDFINAELGGVDGRPVELIPCITTFSVEKSRACAQELVAKDVDVVTGGIDITSNGSIPVLEQNKMPYVGGIPINFDEMRSPISFQFSGGVPGAFTAFAYDAATRLKAKKVAVTYGDYASIKSAGVDYGVGTLKKLGVTDVADLPFPITTTDFLPVLTKANEGNPDAIFLGAADTSCAPAMKTAKELGIQAKLYLVGSCLAPSIPAQIGEEAVEGRIFNIEGPKGNDDPEAKIYFDIVAKYGDPQLPAASSATISFRDVLNIYAALKEIGPANVSPESIIDFFRKAKDRPSFTGHPYTCDGRQIPDLPALCAPQQLLVERRNKSIVPLGDWVDIPALVKK